MREDERAPGTRAAAGGPDPGRRPTVDDVARLARVSRQTVSRVLNASGPVAVGTRERVERAVAELAYEPDPRAQALGRNRRPSRPVPSRLPPECADAIRTLRAAGLLVRLRPSAGSFAVDVAVPARP